MAQQENVESRIATIANNGILLAIATHVNMKHKIDAAQMKHCTTSGRVWSRFKAIFRCVQTRFVF
jgi:hypothetical protein